jgi:hypothetical protein
MDRFTSQGRDYQVVTHPVSLAQAQVFTKDEWVAISHGQNTHGFLSWHWVQNWLQHHPLIEDDAVDGLFVSRLYHDNAVVGITLVTTRKVRYAGIFAGREGFVHRTGDAQHDQIWPEYIRPLVLPEHHTVSPRWLQALAGQIEVDQLHMGVALWSPLYNPEGYDKSPYAMAWDSEEGGGHRVITTGEPVAHGRRVRRMLSQTRTALAAQNVTYTPLSDDGEWQAAWLFLKREHSRKWAGTATPSGFTNPAFEAFLRTLPRTQSLTKGGLIGFALRIDGELSGVTLGLTESDWFGFYLSAYIDMGDNRCRLGILMHDATMQWLAAQDAPTTIEYDFMAGDAEYKRQMGVDTRRYGMLRLHRKRGVIAFIEGLRRIKNMLGG